MSFLLTTRGYFSFPSESPTTHPLRLPGFFHHPPCCIYAHQGELSIRDFHFSATMALPRFFAGSFLRLVRGHSLEHIVCEQLRRWDEMPPDGPSSLRKRVCRELALIVIKSLGSSASSLINGRGLLLSKLDGFVIAFRQLQLPRHSNSLATVPLLYSFFSRRGYRVLYPARVGCVIAVS